MSVFPIRAFVGPNGAGKTLAMVEKCALPAWERGQPVVANFRLLPQALGFDPGLYRPLGSWRDLSQLDGVTLLLDEISSALPARQSMSAPPQLIRLIEQLRKQDTLCAWTAPRWEACDIALRRCTQGVTLCVGRVPDRWERDVPTGGAWWPRRRRDDEGRPVRVEHGWPPNRLHLLRTYDAADFDDHISQGKASELKPMATERYWRTKHRAMHAYTTLETVDMLDHLDDAGLCVACGGYRSRPKCSCARPEPKAAAAAVGAGPAPVARPRDRGPR